MSNVYQEMGARYRLCLYKAYDICIFAEMDIRSDGISPLKHGQLIFPSIWAIVMWAVLDIMT